MEYGLIGNPLGHSFSKPIHEALGGYAYQLCPLEPEALPGFLQRRDFLGVNVTIPYKAAVIPYLDQVDPMAKAIGAVNTIVNRGGRLIGYNTDYLGFLHLARAAGVDFAGKNLLILGSGGTSHTVSAAARAQGARRIQIASRSPGPGQLSYEQALAQPDVELLVNTTPLGMYPNNQACPIDPGAFPCLTAVLDVVYNPLHTCLVQQARALGLAAAGGLAMLVAQAKYAAELFLNRPLEDGALTAISREIWAKQANLVLIGMPGSGKTSLGRLCAKALGRPFLDVDAAVEAAAGMAVSRIFQQEGEEGFRRRETQAVQRLARETGQVIATGGGCVLRRENLQALAQNGVILLVERPLDQLALGAGRPLSGSREAVEALYQARQPRYRQAAAGVIQNHTTLEEAARQATAEFLRLARPSAYRKDSNI